MRVREGERGWKDGGDGTLTFLSGQRTHNFPLMEEESRGQSQRNLREGFKEVQGRTRVEGRCRRRTDGRLVCVAAVQYIQKYCVLRLTPEVSLLLSFPEAPILMKDGLAIQLATIFIHSSRGKKPWCRSTTQYLYYSGYLRD